MRVLVVEDSKEIAASLHTGLSRAGFEVTATGNGREGLRLALGRRWDVVILDLMLPDLPGLEVLQRIRESGSEVHVLILTALGAVEDRVHGLQAGADDYLGKPFSFEEVLARVQALIRRNHGQRAPVIRVGDLEVDTVARAVSRNGEPISLTNREYRLLEYLALRSGDTVSRKEIEEHLYGSRSLPLSNVVDSAVCSVRSKLKRHGEAALIHTRPRLGYLLSTEAP